MKELKYDVIVVGGGPSGTVAAIAASREGKKTLLVERFGYLGGMLTNAGTGPMMTFHAGETQVIKGIADEIVENMKDKGYSPGHMKDFVGYASSVTPFSSEGMKIVLEDMAINSGVELLYHTNFIDLNLENNRIESIILNSKNNNFKATADVYIDATADADLCVKSNCKVQYGREKDNLAQPMTMNAKVYNVDREKLRKFLHENVEKTFAKSHEVIDCAPRIGISAQLDSLKFAIKNKELSFNREAVLCFETNNKGEFIINMSRISGLSAVDPFDLTKAEVVGRKQIVELINYLRNNVPGFEDCILMQTGPNIGIRESNKLIGEYVLTGEDLLSNTMFEDAIAMGGYPIDIHSPEGKEETSSTFLKEGSWYSIPYRSLVTKCVQNLIVVGRCISSSHESLAAVRVTPIVMAIGQAGGTAASQAINENKPVYDIDIIKLKETLINNGQFLEEYR